MRAILILSDFEHKLIKALEIPAIPEAGKPIILGIPGCHLKGALSGVSKWVLVGLDLIPHINICMEKSMNSRTLEFLYTDGWNEIITDSDVWLTCRALHLAKLQINKGTFEVEYEREHV